MKKKTILTGILATMFAISPTLADNGDKKTDFHQSHNTAICARSHSY